MTVFNFFCNIFIYQNVCHNSEMFKFSNVCHYCCFEIKRYIFQWIFVSVFGDKMVLFWHLTDKSRRDTKGWWQWRLLPYSWFSQTWNVFVVSADLCTRVSGVMYLVHFSMLWHWEIMCQGPFWEQLMRTNSKLIYNHFH